jgi:AcrR family transcriptional regulator
MAERKKFRRESEETRRDQLMSAAIDIVAEQGLQAATVRQIAARAGVTQGLIRHYFASKEELTREAYLTFMTRMTDANADAAAEPDNDAERRLANFVAAALRPPVMSPQQVSVWSAFLARARHEPDLGQIHVETYLAYRNRLQDMIAALPSHADPALARRAAIALNGMIDGLWLEGSYAASTFAPDELAEIILDAAGKLLGHDLLRHHSPPTEMERTQDN